MEWTTDHQEWYRNVYLKSDHWRELRGRKLKVNPICERCSASDVVMDVHHVNYRNIFDVTLPDLLSLCRKCHYEEHQKNGAPKRQKISYEDYFPLNAQIKMELAAFKRREIMFPEDAYRRFKHLDNKPAYLAFVLMTEGKCASCKTTLDTTSMKQIKRGKRLASKVYVCPACFDHKYTLPPPQDQTMVRTFNYLLNEINRRVKNRKIGEKHVASEALEYWL